MVSCSYLPICPLRLPGLCRGNALKSPSPGLPQPVDAASGFNYARPGIGNRTQRQRAEEARATEILRAVSSTKTRKRKGQIGKI